jgi:hypothetical protein
LGEFFGPCELLVKFGRGAGFACHRQREAVTVFGNSLDGIPAQRFSQATYDIREVGFAYECAGPQRVRQFFLRDKTLGFREQAEQSIKTFGLDGNRRAFAYQKALRRVKLKIAEAISGGFAGLIFL